MPDGITPDEGALYHDLATMLEEARNRVFEGTDERVDSMVAWCRRGPAGARVDDVEVTWEEPVGEAGFWVVD